MKPFNLLNFFFALYFYACSSPSLQGCFPVEELPSHITPLTSFGERAEWSLDGQKVFFVDSAGGDVWMVDIRTKKTHKVTKSSFRPLGHGYYRALCLANGDLLFTCGPERYKLYFQVMDKNLQSSPVTIPGEKVNEGPAISRKSMKIAWTPDHKQIYQAEIEYKDGRPFFINKQLIIDNTNVEVDGIRYQDILEPQNFRPPDENELIWSQYGETAKGIFTSEVFGVNLTTGILVNYSKAPDQYDEPEGIFPNGQFILVECDRHHREGTSFIDIYRLKLDGTSNDYQRLTFFSDVKGFRASNPVVREDGKLFAFQASRSGSAPGAGCGLYLFDLGKYESR